ncbi:hypothetical protein LSUE1_G001090 [Lachnellula suecica]|uniref:Rhodopsin domain-containing protein n=1 Tax=Lachnellula suecica TaxID=602035 RepID=A0A8T9CFM6_9HELO|nr:hypothetical protein LSUE1_G001090 [Lachnellula suecica]
MSTTSHQGLTALSSAMLGLSTIAVGLRFYTRNLQRAVLKADDWIMIPTLADVKLSAVASGDNGNRLLRYEWLPQISGEEGQCLFLSLSGLQQKVLGYPTPTDHKIPVSTAAMTSKVLYMAFDWFSMATLGCIKISALFFYHRLFCVGRQWNLFKGLVITSVGVVVLWTCAFMILTGLQCGTHFSALWIKADYKKYCHISYPYLLGFAISDFLLDLWIICLPIPQIWAIKSTNGRKFAIMGVFALAFVYGFGACIARMVVYIQIAHAGPQDHDDPRLVNTKGIYLSVLEAGLSCVAVNLPTLWYLISKATPNKVLRGIWSIVSLGSIRSPSPTSSRIWQRSRQSQPPHPYQNSDGKRKSLASSSQSYLHRPDAIEIETFATHDIESRVRKSTILPTNVQVTKTLSQVSEYLKVKE